MASKTQQNSENISPVGWYIAAYLLRFTLVGQAGDDAEDQTTAWENTILVKAADPDEAYEKAVAFANEECEPYENTEGQLVKFEFEGLTSLLPIYEELEDGAEILWVEHTNKTRQELRQMVKQKHELEVFES